MSVSGKQKQDEHYHAQPRCMRSGKTEVFKKKKKKTPHAYVDEQVSLPEGLEMVGIRGSVWPCF